MNPLFGYHTLADQVGVSADDLARLEERVRHLHGGDEMMFELRMVRTLEAIGERTTTLEDAIRELTEDARRQAVRSA